MRFVEWINEIIMGLIDTYSTNNPYDLCNLLNIKIIKVNHECLLLSGNNSLYIRDYFGEEVIFLRSDLNSHYEEFYLSHEIGHAILHAKIYNSGLCNLGKLERQANYFALKLSDVTIDEVELRDMSLSQIAGYLKLPYEPLKQLVSSAM